MHCVRCHAPVAAGERFCEYCGAPLKPGPWRPTARLLTVAGLVAVLVLASTQVYRGLKQDVEAVAGPTTLPATTTVTVVTAPSATPAPATVAPPAPVPTALPVAIVKAARIVARKPTAAATNACGQVDTFDASFLQDGDFSTAWRVKGAGVGQRVQLRLAAPTRITEVGLVPGWAKVDGCDGSDLFRQNRTVAKVRWLFDGGSYVDQDLDPAPDLQVQAVDIVTRNVTVQILATNAPNGIDMTPISEIRLGGLPA